MASPLYLLVRIAWRNLGRNRRRTLIAGGAIALGVSMCIASFGIMDGMSSDMVRSITDVQLGHVQVHQPGFSTQPKLGLAFDKAGALAREAQDMPGVQAASPRVIGWALASSPRESAGVQLVGVSPANEAKLTHLDRRVVRGAYLPEAPVPWPRARQLSAAEQAIDDRLTSLESERAAAEIEALGNPENKAPPAKSAATLTAETQQLLAEVAPGPSRPPPILLGEKLAKKLGAGPGTRLDTMATDIDGNPANVAFEVVGVVRTGDSALDAVRAVANLADVQRFLGLEDRAHELALRLADPRDAKAVVQRLAAKPQFRGLEVKTWQELRPDVVAMIQTNSVSSGLMILIIFAIAAIGVADTVLMGVFERRRELGVLKAVGMRPAAIVLMVATETLLLGIGASVVGLLLGTGVDLWLQRWGIPLGGLSGFTMAGASVPPVLHATITEQGALLPVVLMVIMALLASLWPAVLAARTEPVVAMRDR